MRSGERDGVSQGAGRLRIRSGKGKLREQGGCYLSRSPGSVGGGFTPKHTTSGAGRGGGVQGCFPTQIFPEPHPGHTTVAGSWKEESGGQQAADLRFPLSELPFARYYSVPTPLPTYDLL